MAIRLDRYMTGRREMVERYLDRALPQPVGDVAVIHRAMRYAVLGGGKRLRALLVLAAGEACGGRAEDLLAAAAGLEMIHAYSLVHDDLPCMDDDDFRRGKPTVHRKFGEAMAVLAGDALLTKAFEVMVGLGIRPRVGLAKTMRALRIFSESAGTAGLIGGQVADLQQEGRKVTVKTVEGIHLRKTGALITAAVQLGGVVGGGSERDLLALTAYGRAAGLAFQIIDDCLNESGDPKVLGKGSKSDRARGKATYPRVMGLEASYQEAQRLKGLAESALRPLGSRGTILFMLADKLVKRAK